MSPELRRQFITQKVAHQIVTRSPEKAALAAARAEAIQSKGR